MNFEEVETIVTVSRSKSFNEAAYLLNYAPSTISKAVSSVEQEIGYTLFVRGNRANAASLTAEGKALMPDFIRIYDSMQQLKSDLSAMQKDNKDLLRIGSTSNIGFRSRDEIVADFMIRYPEIRLEQEKTDFATLLHMLYSGGASGVFLYAQEGSRNLEMLKNVMADPKLEAIRIDTEHEMYLAVSEREPLAQQDEAPFAAFRDYALLVHPDKNVVLNAGIVDPFRALSKTAGFPLKTMALDLRDPATFYLATKMKLAIPCHPMSFSYPGIKLVRVTDWNCDSHAYFLTRRVRSGRAIGCLLRCIREHVAAHSIEGDEDNGL